MSSAIKPTAPKSADAAVTADVAGPSFEDRLNVFWAKNKKLLVLICAAVLLAIVGRGVGAYLAEQSRQGLAQDYAKAVATPEGLRRFAEANAGIELGGVAWLQIADTAYEASDFSTAAQAYQQSLRGLGRGSVLADRAALGLAVSQLRTEQAAQGRSGLAALADSPATSIAIRSEAAYHLAISAHVAGDQATFHERSAQVAQIDPASLWNQRLLSLQVTRSLVDAGAQGAAVAPPAAPNNAAAASALNPATSILDVGGQSSAAPAVGSEEPLIRLNIGDGQ